VNESSGQSTEFNFDLIQIAPAPILTRFLRPDDRVTGGAKVLRRMFILRRVATSDVAANHAKAQVHPDIAHFEAFFASPCVRFDILDLIDM
jgi:hypothetical protein